MPRDLVEFPEIVAPVEGDTVLRNLVNARAAIANETNWCAGDRCNSQGQRCALGALEKVMSLPYAHLRGDAPEVMALAAFAKADGWDPETSVAYHNNKLGHAATLEMFDRAIAARRSELTA